MNARVSARAGRHVGELQKAQQADEFRRALRALLMRPLLRTLLTVALPEPPPWFWLMTMRLDSITPRRVLSSVLTAERPRAWPWLPATNTWLPVMRPRLRTLFTWPSSALSPRLPTMVI